MAGVLFTIVVVVVAIPIAAFLLAMMAAGVIFTIIDGFILAIKDGLVTVVPA